MYPDEIVNPCRDELTQIGFEELRTASEVQTAIEGESGTMLLVVNSVCGCAAGSARPAVRLALEHSTIPDRIVTVFAGVDTEATAKARSYMTGRTPSSPAIALFKNGQLAYMLDRHMIEGREPESIAKDVKKAFDKHCGE
ncbi:MAG: BrxA/BrxB family bacilliredoxin [Candidatus Latescibacterota bacterium]|nr:MAG: BrxA/BrxB family bacilliredoxin [Candidatus Latescibacterota bacterium]